MEIDGWCMLFYDKYAQEHTFNNARTINKSINDVFSMEGIQLYNDEAIIEFNKFGGQYMIPADIDKELYQIIVVIATSDNIPNGEKYTIVGINTQKLKNFVSEKIQIPNESFLITLCKYHMLYNKAQQTGGKLGTSNDSYLINETTQEIIKNILSKTGDIVDPMIENPKYLTINLHPYQKRSINWMLQKENMYKSILFNLNDEINIGDTTFDIFKQSFIMEDSKKKLQFRGGALIDEVGLGKTIQMATLSLLNPSNDSRYIRPNSDKLYSRATLILCPNQLCGQWKRELEDKIKSDYNISIISVLTKVHFDKYTYQDLLDADFVILSYSFLDNKSFLDPWMNKISKNKSYHKSPSSVFDRQNVQNILNTMKNDIIKDPSLLCKTGALLQLIHWHRIIVDEFHEVHTVGKYGHIINLLPLFDATYKWCVSGTPFDKNINCLYNMIDFTTGYTNLYGNKIILNQNIKNHVLTHFFRRNTKKSVNDEYKLPPLKEKIIWLKFSSTERMMYNAYLANPNNDKFSIMLRQLCCHPKLAEETKLALSNCKTLDDIEAMMVKHYSLAMKLAEKKMKNAQLRIKILEAKINKYIKKRQKTLLKRMGYRVTIEKTEINDQELLLTLDDMEDLQGIDLSIFNDVDSDSDSDEDDDEKKQHIIVNDNNYSKNIKIIGKQWDNNRITLDNMYATLDNCKKRLGELTKDYEGKKTTYDFYNNVMDRIKKTVTKNCDSDDDSDNDSNNDSDEEEETCGICLGEILENDMGVTKCGHIFCYQCIKSMITQKHECPYCRKKLKDDDLYMISYEKKKKNKDDELSKEIKDKLALINEVGTKLANLIYYLKQSDKHTIIFSQWDDLLIKVGGILDMYGIKNTFCRGNVWQRDKAIRTFNSDNNVKVIMLSSESAASGTNLTKASQVILLDPVYGSYEFRRNTEWQAVGRAHRMGQTKEVEVIRFIIKDTVEEDIYKMNQEEDKKFKTDVKIFESNDDQITLSNDKVIEISKSAENSKKNVQNIKKKVVKTVPKCTSNCKKGPVKCAKEISSDSDSDFDEGVVRKIRKVVKPVVHDSDSDSDSDIDSELDDE